MTEQEKEEGTNKRERDEVRKERKNRLSVSVKQAWSRWGFHDG